MELYAYTEFTICEICNKNLPNYKFTKNFTTICHICKVKEYSNRYRTKDLLPYRIYMSQVSVSKVRGHSAPSYTLEELREWLYNQELFHELHDEWVKSGYEKALKPSVDRIKDEIKYEFGNIQLMTFEENYAKGIEDHRKRLLKGIKFLHRSLYN